MEERFYLAWPALLIILLRYRVPLVPALAVLGAASFAAAVLLTRLHSRMTCEGHDALPAPAAAHLWCGMGALTQLRTACLYRLDPAIVN